MNIHEVLINDYIQDYTYEGDFELEASRERGLPSSHVMKALPMPRHTALSQARVVSILTLYCKQFILATIFGCRILPMT